MKSSDLFSRLLSVWILAASLPVSAATVEVIVRERGAGAIAGERVALRVEGDYRAPRFKQTTDQAGKATFGEVPPGRYTVEVGGILDGRLVPPRDNPWAPPPKRVITAADDHVEMVVELWPGAAVVGRWLAEPESSDVATIVFTSDGGGSVRIQTLSGEPYDKLLPPGRWIVSLEPPEGYVLEDLQIDGVTVTGASATIDLEEDRPARNVTWRLAAPCLVSGRVDVVGTPPADWVLMAGLVEAGSWKDAALLRGSPIPDRVTARRLDDEHYEIHLPAGRWRLEADAPGLEASEPPFADLTLVPGEARRVDFRLQFSDEGASMVRVLVLDPQERPLRDALVELHSIDQGGDVGPAVATARSDLFAFLRAPGKGSFLVVAGHDEFEEASEKIAIGKGRPPSVTIKLRAGATLLVHVTGTAGDGIGGVRIEATREGELPTQLSDPEFASRKSHAVARTDLSGLAELAGLYPGRYRVEGFAGEGSEVFGVVTFGKAGEAPRPASLELSEGGREPLEAKLLPASGIAGSLRCAEGSIPAPYAALRVFPVEAAHDAWDDEDLRKGAVLALDRVPLKGMKGKELDRFAAGPLDAGAFKIAIRPVGVEAWTWVGGRFAVRDALTVQLEPGTTAELGTIVAECGPIVLLTPRLASKEEPPELDPRHVELTAKIRARIEDVDSRVVALGLPEGAVQLKVHIEHPYLVPPVIETTLELPKLERGTIARVPIEFERIGGVLEIHTAQAAVRARTPERKPVIVRVVDGVALIPGLAPGSYEVDVCTDAACEHATPTWSKIAVEPGRTAHVP